jgi:HAD superfamily hydrolase (TIGR01549 family)
MSPLAISSFLEQGSHFFEELAQEMLSLGFKKSDLQADHLCFRVATNEEYALTKQFLLEHADLLTEAPVNGRLISTFHLHQPFSSSSGAIPLLELPQPKSGTPYVTGFEHAEFVIKESFAALVSRHPSLSFTHAGPKILNPELGLSTRAGQAKFHHHSLERVIAIEEAPVRDVIFDFDGTLIDARAKIYEINSAVFSRLLGREVSLAEARRNHSADFPQLFEKFGIVDLLAREHGMQVWREVSQTRSFELFDGILELLQTLRSQGFRLHVWTAREEASTRQIMKDLALDRFFETLSSSTALVSKPHSDSVVFDWRSARRDSVLMVGDSWTDMHGAKNIGAIAAAALWDTEVCPEHLSEEGAELYFRSPKDLADYLNVRAPKVSQDS